MSRAFSCAFQQLRGVRRIVVDCEKTQKWHYWSLNPAQPSLFALQLRHASNAETSSTAGAQANAISMKHESGLRLTSSEFLDKVKALIGPEAVGEENFDVPRSAFDPLAAEYDRLIEENQEWKDKYTRALAETENVRRRGQKQVDDTKIYAIQGFCKDLLEVADILKMAATSVDPSKLEPNSPLANMHKGIAMTESALMKTFAKHGLAPIAPEGEKFDPNLHEAVFQIPINQAKLKPGMVEQVMKIGYSLHGRPIRPAQVGVVQQ